MTRAEVERRLREVEWPEPPVELRVRVLSSAPRVDGGVSWSDRIWFSRACRLTAAAAVVGAIGVASSTGAPAVKPLPSPTAIAEAQMIDDTGREIGLPPSLAAALAQRSLLSEAQPIAAERRRLALQALETDGVWR